MLLRSADSSFAAVGLHSLPEALGVNDGCSSIIRPRFVSLLDQANNSRRLVVSNDSSNVHSSPDHSSLARGGDAANLRSSPVHPRFGD
jgi:hypothetical protein